MMKMKLYMKLRLLLIVLFVLLNVVLSVCPNNCSGHGKCENSVCSCYSDSKSGENYVGSDCSLRGCSVGNPFSAVGSVYGSKSKVYGSSSSSSSSRELSSNRKLVNGISEENIGFSLKLAKDGSLISEGDDAGKLWKVEGIERLVEPLPASGGILSCVFTPGKTPTDASVEIPTELNVISHTSTSIYVLFDEKVTEISENADGDNEYKSVICSDILSMRNDLTQFNPLIKPIEATASSRLLSNNNSTRELLSTPTLTLTWNGYYPILKDMGLLKPQQGKEDVYESNEFVFACYTPPSSGSQRELGEVRLLEGEITGVELKIYRGVTAKQDTDENKKNNVKFTITGKTEGDVPKQNDICICAMEDDGSKVNLEESDISENIRIEVVDGKDKYLVGKYTTADDAKSDRIAFGSITNVGDKEITGLSIPTNEDDKLYFGENRIVYGTILENGIFKEVEVRIGKNNAAAMVDSTITGFLLPYLRSSAINPLTPPPKPFISGNIGESINIYKAYYFAENELKYLKREGGILKCKHTAPSRERMLGNSATDVTVDVRGIVKDSKGVIMYSYIEVKKNSDGTPATVGENSKLECSGIISIRNDMTDYNGLSALTIQGSSAERQLINNNEIQWDGYGAIFKDMKFISGASGDKVNFGCFSSKPDDKTKEIVDYVAELNYDGDNEVNVKFTFTPSDDESSNGNYLCFMKTKFNKKDVILEESDIKNKIVYDPTSKKYNYGEYLISDKTRYVKEGENEVIVLHKDSTISLSTSTSSTITIPDFENIPNEIQKSLSATSAKFSLKVIKFDNSKYVEKTVDCTISEITPPDSRRLLLAKTTISISHKSSAFASNDIPFYVMYLTIPKPSDQPTYKPTNEIRNIDINSYFYEITNFLDEIRESLPVIGGKIECKIDEEDGVGLIDIRGIVDNKMYIKLEKPLSMRRRLLSVENEIILDNIRDCRVLSIRKDMSLYNILKVSKSNYDNVNGIMSWTGYGEIFSSMKGEVVCYTPKKENANNDEEMKIYSNVEIYGMKNKNNNNNKDIKIRFIKSNKPSDGDICYMLSDSNGLNVINIENSELFENIRKTKEGKYYFGKYVINSESGKSEENKKSDGSVEILFDNNKYLDVKPKDEKERFDKKNIDKIDLFDVNNPSSPSVYVPNDMIGIESEKMLIIGNTIELIFISKETGESWIGVSQILKIEKDELGRYKILLSNPIYLPPAPSKTESRLRSLAGGSGTVNSNLIIKLNWKSEGSTHVPLECSGQGICDRESGLCKCFNGYSGSACQRLDCPNGCNGNGRCVSLSELLRNDELKKYIGFGNKHTGQYIDDDATKNKNMEFDNQVYGCLCDKRHRGYDCSLIECPSGEDPEGGTNIVSSVNGLSEYRDCSGRGICDYSSGICECFDGFSGEGCQTQIGTI